jgi:hypothetical protein
MANVTEKSAVYTAPPENVAKSLAPISGLIAGIFAAICSGIGVGAGFLPLTGVVGNWLNMQFIPLAGLLLAVLFVLGITYLSVRRFRPHMSAEAFKHLYMHNLIRTTSWAVGSYVIWFILISPILSMILHNLHVKGF